jgi:outer membrane protein OmpA-like peptidoglycan-associated protein
MRLPVHKIILISYLLLLSAYATAQKETIKNYFEDGRLKSKGQTYTYSIPYESKSIPKKYPFGEVQKKIKKWEYWYQNGQLQRIEHYKLIKDRNFSSLPHGKWVYFNETGTKYKEESYNNGALKNTTKEVFQDSRNAGFISLNNGVADTAVFLPITEGKNLVINSDFDFFYYKPVLITYHGDSKIEDWIPYWTTPGLYTPDYLSNLRYIDVFSYNYIFDMPLPNTFNYVGIALYKESDSYSEYIQGKLISPLIKGKKYCLRTSLNFCSYSKYSVDRLAFYLSSSSVSVNYKNESTFSPQINFSKLPAENKHFSTLCDYFIADGGEQFVTAGRFTGPENVKAVVREEYPYGLFGLEKASYYILDNIELFEIQDTSECNCRIEILPVSPKENIPEVLYETDLNKLKQGIPVILENVNFKFDSYNLLPASEEILKTLLTYLGNNPEIKINIEGHTDDIGTEQYNDELSINRARSVNNWLINKGINSARLSFTGFGKSSPIFSEKDEEHRALNRRVEVRIIKN